MTRSVILSEAKDLKKNWLRSFVVFATQDDEAMKMAKRVLTAISKMPRLTCAACHGMGAIRMTVHFHTGDHEFEAPCWECFGSDVRVQFPKPGTTDNA